MIPSTISCNYMLSFATPTTQTALLSTWKQERSLARYAARVAECSKASLILPRLYLSSFRIASDEDELVTLGITHVVSVLEYPPEYTNDKFKTLHIKIEDTLESNILEHLQTTTEFIRTALEENETNKVLVHCMMGVSRSATVVCAYLVATTPMVASEAIEFVRRKRSIVHPNNSFQQQLEKYAFEFYGKSIKTKRATKYRITDEVAEKIRRFAGLKSVHLRNTNVVGAPDRSQ
ncbi:hypothetical protein NM688_g3818 [Phlebia brevispora]|uniref:Uncharacterized protein n=1 Tax=Phlebia brevispora TaxID=194682 RepID=A0ACC1T4N8_9APHY|nr:hypothetical protein NM688_g3818 [Phlebia brevispora]